MNKKLLTLILLEVVILVVSAENSESAQEPMADSLPEADEESEDPAPTNTLRFAKKSPSKEEAEELEDDPKSGSQQNASQYSEDNSGADTNKTMKPPKLNMTASLFPKLPEKREINPKNFPTTKVAQTSSSNKIKFCIILSLLIALAC